VRIKRLTAPPEVAQRLRELGFCEEQCVRLLRQNGHLICQISQVRMGLSHRVAKAIWVVPAPAFNLPG
jgi:Fe2+ transport system protein FeoA